MKPTKMLKSVFLAAVTLACSVNLNATPPTPQEVMDWFGGDQNPFAVLHAYMDGPTGLTFSVTAHYGANGEFLYMDCNLSDNGGNDEHQT